MNHVIKIFDTTLRDGEQSPGCSMNLDEKLRMAIELSKLNVDIIEAGFPVASQGDFEAVKTIAKEVKGPVVAGLSRANKMDIDRCWEAVKNAARPRIHTFIATSDIHLKYKLNKTREQVLEEAAFAVAHAKHYTPDVEFSAEDATRSDRAYLAKVFETVIASGATTINVPDTVGYTIPSEFGALIRYLKENVPNINQAVISVHCHNDLGLAVANSLVAVENGARQVECTVNGIGERAGNASLEEIVMTLNVRKDKIPYTTSIRTEQIYPASKLLTHITGMHVQPNKAIVGDNAFAHEAGIHQDGILKYQQTYEIMTPQSIGLKSSSIVLGKHSGRHAFEKKTAELGFKLAGKEFEKAFSDFKALADKKKNVYDEDIEAIIENELAEEKQIYELSDIFISSGSSVKPVAKIKLKKDKKLFFAESSGDGPVDSSYKAIEKIIGRKFKLVDYSLKSVSIGKDAVGEAIVKIEHKGKIFIGRGTSTDVIEASVKAYLSAINRILRNR